jgi:hypothetical protein
LKLSELKNRQRSHILKGVLINFIQNFSLYFAFKKRSHYENKVSKSTPSSPRIVIVKQNKRIFIYKIHFANLKLKGELQLFWISLQLYVQFNYILRYLYRCIFFYFNEKVRWNKKSKTTNYRSTGWSKSSVLIWCEILTQN